MTSNGMKKSRIESPDTPAAHVVTASKRGPPNHFHPFPRNQGSIFPIILYRKLSCLYTDLDSLPQQHSTPVGSRVHRLDATWSIPQTSTLDAPSDALDMSARPPWQGSQVSRTGSTQKITPNRRWNKNPSEKSLQPKKSTSPHLRSLKYPICI